MNDNVGCIGIVGLILISSIASKVLATIPMGIVYLVVGWGVALALMTIASAVREVMIARACFGNKGCPINAPEDEATDGPGAQVIDGNWRE